MECQPKVLLVCSEPDGGSCRCNDCNRYEIQYVSRIYESEASLDSRLSEREKVPEEPEESRRSKVNKSDGEK